MNLNLGFLASHNGSNVKEIVNAIESKDLEAYARVIISNNSDSLVLRFAEEKGIPSYCLNTKNTSSLDSKILNILQQHEVNLVILAGYMKKLSNEVLQAYPNRVLNIHPALLPKYGGKGMYGIKVHEAVIASDDKETGATIHLVTPNYDEGRILSQYKVPRYNRDTVGSLAERVLKIEHVLYTQVLRDIKNEIILLE